MPRNGQTVAASCKTNYPRSIPGILILFGSAMFAVSCNAPKSTSSTAANEPGPQRPTTMEAPRQSTLPEKKDMPGLHNLVAFHDGFISGSAPEDRTAFASLSELGIRTIISVDGAEPDVEAARTHGIRYIHLPIGYNGFDDARRRQLVRATRDAMRDGPVYIHCHHGKHRSAAAAAVIAASLGWMTPQEGVERMRYSGTAANYKGLYECARRTTVRASNEIDATSGDFAPIWAPSSFVKGMLELDAAFENMKGIEAAGWMTPKDHPDLVPVAEAGRIADLYRVMRKTGYATDRGEAFAKLLEQAELEASELERALAESNAKAETIARHFRAVTVACKDCHARFRD